MGEPRLTADWNRGENEMAMLLLAGVAVVLLVLMVLDLAEDVRGR